MRWGLSVLVVEDELIIRMLMVDALEEAGFEVVEAATGQAALFELQRNPGLKALLTDIEMPGKLDGLTYAPFMHKIFGSRPIAFSDGVLIVAIGAVVLIICEAEKTLLRRTGLLARLQN